MKNVKMRRKEKTKEEKSRKQKLSNFFTLFDLKISF